MDRREFIRSTSSVLSLALLSGCRDAADLSPPAGSSAVDLSTSAIELARYDAMGQAALFKDGEVTALELVEAAIERIERYDGALNSVVHKAYDYARQAAKVAAPEGDFAGVPYLLKCLEAKEGMPQTGASNLRANNIAERSDPVTLAAETTGLIYLGNTNAPEAGTIVSTEPTLYGATNNPWDLTRSPAGSSGGSAAAVAAGLVPIATADDGGGSTRLPASNCGVVGLKASRAREVGHEGSFTTNTGCNSRTIRDTAAFLNATERKDNPELPPVGMVLGPNSRRLKVAFSSVGIREAAVTDSEIAQGIEEIAEALGAAGHQVTEARFEVDGDAFWDAFFTVWNKGLSQMVQAAKQTLGRTPDVQDLEPWTLYLAALGDSVTDEDVERAMAHLRRVSQEHRVFFETYDIQLTPVTQTPPLTTGSMDPRDPNFERTMEVLLDFTNFTPLFNATGLPAMSLPLKQTSGGLPWGAHFGADLGNEARLLELAYELEEMMPWAQRWPPHSVFAEV